jgi:hypothetical protein
MEGIGLTMTDQIEIISAYTATNQTIAAVAAEPGWLVVGAFNLPIGSAARLQIIGEVSDPSLVMNVRLFDMTAVAPVSGSNASLATTVDSTATSGVITLMGGREYQIQAEVVGNAGAAYFGSMKSATLI